MTGKNTPPTIVHEAEAQRQHIRIPLPVRVEVAKTFLTAADWSNGGVGLQLENGAETPKAFKPGSKLAAIIHYPFEGFNMSLPVTLEVTHIDVAAGRIGCSFSDLNRQQKSVIQYFVTAYVSGEIIRVNDIMDVVSRNNFTRARNVPDAFAGLSSAEIRRRKLGNLMRASFLAAIALLLTGYVAISAYERLFIVSATSGRITAEMFTVDAPVGGKVYFNAIAPDTKVKQGEPLLTLSSSTGNTLTLDSPCDCIVKRRIADNNSIARKSDPLLELVRPDAVATVEAYVHHKDAVKLAVGEESLLSIPGDDRHLRGKITAIQAGRGLKGNALVMIKPTTPLPVSSIDDPVEIRVDTQHLFYGMLLIMKLTPKRLAVLSVTTLLLAGGVFLALRSGDVEGGSSPLQPLWLKAETEQDPTKAAQKWEELYESIKQSPTAIDTGIPPQSVSKMLFSAYLKVGETVKAEAMIPLWQEREKIWAELLVAQHLIKREGSGDAWKLVAQAAQEAQTITNQKNRSYTLHAVVAVALSPKPGKSKILEATSSKQLVFEWDGPQLAEKLIPQIVSPWHRADAMHLLALVTPDAEGEIPRQLQEALRIPLAKAKDRQKFLLKVHKEALREDLFYPALDALSGIEDSNLQQKMVYEWSTKLLEDKEYSRAIAAAQRLNYDRHGTSAWGRLAVYFAREGEEVRAKEALERCHASAMLTHYEDDRAEAMARDKKFTSEVAKSLESFRKKQEKNRKSAAASAPLKEALSMLEAEDLRNAVDLVKATPDARLRTLQFRTLAEKQAQQTDYYGMLGSTKSQRFLAPEAKSNDISDTALNALENAITQQSGDSKKGLDLRSPPASSLGHKIPLLPLAENLALTRATLREKLPLPSAFSVRRVYYANSYFVYTKFKVALGEATANLREKLITPEIIFLERGTATLPQIYDALRAQGIDDYITKEDTVYTLRRGLVVGQNASLTIDGAEVVELRQSIQHGAILVNAGTLHISDARLMSWDEENATSPRRFYEEKYNFRPFVSAWSGSRSYIGGSEFLNLGYAKSKSFSLTFTTGPKKMLAHSLFQAKRPQGAVVDTSFINPYYGFYSFEADKIAVVGNEYRDSVVYGIDPHDRSRELTIAYNTAYDSQKKHGIIISREVDDSSYIGNLSFDNSGSGFMLDRMSTGTYIYGNTAFNNKQDGLTLFESSCNLIASNHFFDNQSVGLRARNSQDNGIFFNRLEKNQKGGILGYTSRLEVLASQATRDFAMDPYSDVTAMTLIGNHISANKAGILTDNVQALTLRANHFEKQSPKLFQGEWFRKMPYLSNQYNLDKDGVVITDTCPQAEWTPYHCRFRQSGTFSGDGQRDLAKRVNASPCHPAKTKAES